MDIVVGEVELGIFLFQLSHVTLLVWVKIEHEL